MIKSTSIARLDGLMLCTSVDDEQSDAALQEVKGQVKLVLRRLNRNSEPQASIESGNYTIHYLITSSLAFLTITPRSYPRNLAFTYLSDLSTEFLTTHPPQTCHNPSLRPYAFTSFDTFIQRTKATYSDPRVASNLASNSSAGGGAGGGPGNLNALNTELRDVTKVMTKNIEDLLYRGDSLERMGEMSSRLRDDSKKYRRAAQRINWELLLKQYGPVAGVGFLIIVFLWWRFF
ncbi:hypothetical protein MKZ38_004096 [Zalerion maritima]|uniref:Protein transport protein SEC22 n=1 Tax=Zalerion maritima TaxID=339359 RepID=A0AAD5WXH1_9PEZI|nr:hypothetical protein MKZ38_004096 [Zalerion maritima]